MLFVLLILFYQSVHFIQNEGYNPSDDGVILAQSYRILNGEIPHRDFIAIRPVLSGILHSIHFFSPLPVFESSRWFVIFENFITAVFFSLILNMFFNNYKSRKELLLIMIPVTLITFVLNINIYTIYPWTTVDAVMFSIIGLYFMLKNLFVKIEYSAFGLITGFFFFSLALLCRQTFAVLYIFSVVCFLILNIKKKKSIYMLVLIIFFGSLPALIYFFILIRFNSLELFISQMTGRTEILETGVIAYGKSLLKAYMYPVIFLLIVYFIIKIYRKLSNENRYRKILLVLLVLISVSVSVIILTTDLNHLLTFPFVLFWCLAILFVLSGRNQREAKFMIAFVLLISWISSISLGDNSPVFMTGILFTAILIMVYKEIGNKKLQYFFPVVALTLFVLSYYGQREINYRDLSSDKLTYNLGKIYPDFGSIKTNSETFEYMSELKNIVDSMIDTGQRIVVIPNNSYFYFVNNITNPFPLDWMQKDEYIGNELFLSSKIDECINGQSLFLILDKYNSKKLAFEKLILDYSSPLYDFLNSDLKADMKFVEETKYFKVFIIN